ncbi:MULTISPECIES: DUF418 domain-containing protein [unclassified Polaribacter]|uniref:DUF418 domain-containing protein n=1 Tax=unclassified Polaribacter TaxID=196858 RepID=UPI0011BF8BD2|nr:MULTISPECIES: DUF418 domain-containing protein [unclassified Polaribacter]TXD51385.1 DUF418 domain-containing protein [Polaribacter sp. IC063]TXD62310.1 DUF418 domain-containing protein [Polaribacter sp. IC066]
MLITQTSLTPLKALDRIQSIDVMRGIVLFGILLMNINGMALADAYADPTVSGGSTGWDLYTWITTNMLFEGTMRALFSLLFGAGMFILLDRMEKKGAGIKAADIYFRRLTWLLVFGIIHGYLLVWTGEILFNYALMGFLVYSFRNMTPKKLIIIALVLFSTGTVWNYADYKANVKLMENVAMAEQFKTDGKELTEDLKTAQVKWEELQKKRSPEAIAEYNSNMQKNYFGVVAFLAPINMHFETYYLYRYDVWDILSMMLLGIAFFKLKILSAVKSYRFYGIMLGVGYGIGLIVNYYEVLMIMDNNFSFLSFSKSNLTYDLGRVFVAMGHIGAIMLFCKSPILSQLKKALGAVGKMALTNYVMHSVIAMFVFTGAGFGLFGTFQRHELLYIVFAIWIFQLIASPIWLKHYYFGPLEWLWRNLSYQKRHALRKKSSKP